MKVQKNRTSGFEKEHLRLMKHASVRANFMLFRKWYDSQKKLRKAARKGVRNIILSSLLRSLLAVNERVLGSNPSRGANYFLELRNGLDDVKCLISVLIGY